MTLHMTPATLDDSTFLLALRNDPTVRAQSISHEAVSADAHQQWLTTALDDPALLIWVVWDGETPIGTLRLTKKGGVWEVSLALIPDFRGRGIGTWIIYQAHAYSPLAAWVRADNPASIKAFLMNGFRETGMFSRLEWP